MKKCILMLLGLALYASAAAVNPCSSYLGQSVLTAGFTCQDGNAIFSNFSAANGTNDPNPQLYLVTATTVNGDAVVEFNPFLTNATGGSSQSAYYYFQVTNPTTGISLTVGGANATVDEVVCANPITNNTCASGQLASISSSGGVTSNATFGSANTVYVMQHATITSSGASAGHLTSMFESFTTAPGAGGSGGGGSTVPEPATLLLVGGAWLGLSFMIRKGRRV